MLTFFIVSLAWVFFRANDLPAAWTYLKTMAGFVPPSANAYLVSGLIYNPFYLLIMIVAALLTWLWSDSWEWTQRPCWPRRPIIRSSISYSDAL